MRYDGIVIAIVLLVLLTVIWCTPVVVFAGHMGTQARTAGGSPVVLRANDALLLVPNHVGAHQFAPLLMV